MPRVKNPDFWPGITAVCSAGGVATGTPAQVAANFDDLLIRSERNLATIVAFSAAETWNVTGSGATRAADTTTYALGTQSILHTVPAGIASGLSCTLPATKYARGNVGVWLKVGGLANCTDLKVELYETAVSGYHQFILRNHKTNNTPAFGLQEGIWKLLWLRRDMFNPVSSPTAWGTAGNEVKTIGHIRVIAIADGGAVTVNWGGIVTDEPERAGILFGFDDGYKSVIDAAFPILQAAGLRGCVFAYGAGLGYVDANPDNSIMDADDLDTLYAAGWDIGNHTWAHDVLDTETDAEAAEAWHRELRFQRANGWNRGALYACWPGGLASGDSKNLGPIAEKYFRMGRGEITRTEYTAGTGRMTATHVASMPSPWIWHDKMAHPWRTAGTIDNTTFANEQPWFDQVLRDRQVANMVFHRVLAGGGTPSTDCATAYFQALVDYAAAAIAAGTLENITFTDWDAKIGLRGF